MRRTLILVFMIVLLVPDADAPGVNGGPSSATPASLSLTVAFVDNQLVDLMWYPFAGATGYKLYRDHAGAGSALAVETIAGNVWSRVMATQADADAEYQVCAVMADSSENCSSWELVHHEQVKGNLYKNRDWIGLNFELANTVQIMDGATLKIGAGATVSSFGGSFHRDIKTQFGANLIVDGSTGAVRIEDTKLIFDNPNADTSEIKGKQGNHIKLDNVQIETSEAMPIQYCDLGAESKITVFADPQGNRSTLSHNQLTGSKIVLRDGGMADITDNTFSGYDSNGDRDYIKLRDGADATIESNTFLWATGGHGIDVFGQEHIDIGGSTATIELNQADPYFEVLVWPDSGGKVTINNNNAVQVSLASNESDPLYVVRGLGAPDVTVERNILFGLQTGSDMNAKVEHNTLVETIHDSSLGDVSGFLKLRYNCIAGYRTGLVSTSELDATANWWGSPRGPTHPKNPGGDGTVVEGDANYSGYLKKDNCDPRVRNFVACGVEATQAVQRSDNTIPLVAGKPAVVRAYIGSATGVVTGVTGELIVRRDGEYVGTVQPERTVSTLHNVFACPTDTDGQNRLRADKDSSLLFKLPAEWLTPGTYSLAFEVNPGNTIKEDNHGDNTKTVSATVISPKPVSIMLAPILPGTRTRMSSVTSVLESHMQVAELLRKIYPGAQVEIGLLPTMDWPNEMEQPPSYNNPGGPNDLNGALLVSTLGIAQMRLAAEGEPGAGPLDQVHGLFPEGAITYTRADPTQDGARGAISFGAEQQRAFANAVAPNLGYVEDFVEGYPEYTDEFGYDVAADRIMPPGTASALSSDPSLPQDPDLNWIHSQDYIDLLDYNTGALAAQGAPAGSAAPQTYLLASGVIQRSGQVSYRHGWQVTTAQPPLNPPAGTAYCLELQDASESVLQSHCFDIVDWESYPWAWDWHGYQIALPLTGSPARVVLRKGTTVLGYVPISASPPAVSIQANQVQATEGTLILSWSGSDSDGNTLAYSVFYSADNQASWIPAAINIAETSYTLNLAEVPGGTQAWVRVEASDSFHTTSDLYGPFVVEDHGPMVDIWSPDSLAIVSSNPTLSGYAYDMEDGELDGEDLVWTSNIDGELGTGQLLFATDLTTGTHTLTLTATDGEDHSASDSVTVFVGEAGDLNMVFLPMVSRQAP